MPGMNRLFAVLIMTFAVSAGHANVRCEAVFPSRALTIAPLERLRANPVAAQQAVNLLQHLPVLISMKMADNLLDAMEQTKILVPELESLKAAVKVYNSGDHAWGMSPQRNADLRKSLNNLEGNLSANEREIVAEKMSEILIADFYLQPHQTADFNKLTDHLRATAAEYGLEDFNEAHKIRSQIEDILKLPNGEAAIQEMLYVAIPDLGRTFASAHINSRKRWIGVAASGTIGAAAAAVGLALVPAMPELFLPIAIGVPVAGSFTSMFGIGAFTRSYSSMKLKLTKFGIARSARKLIASGQIKEEIKVIDAQYSVVDADTSPLDQSFDRYAIENYTPRLVDLKSSTIMDLGQEFWTASIALSARYSGLIYKHGDIDTALTGKIKKVVDSKTSSQAETLEISKLLQHRRSQISQVAAGMDHLGDDVNLTLHKLLELQSFIQREVGDNPQLQDKSVGAQSAKAALLSQLDSISQNIGEMNTMMGNLRLTQEYLAKEVGYVNLLSQTLVRANTSRTGLSPELLQKFTEFQQQLAAAKLN